MDSSSLHKWCTCQTTNFQYINKINQLLGRSFHDLANYPIFPLINKMPNIKTLRSFEVARMLSQLRPFTHLKDKPPLQNSEITIPEYYYLPEIISEKELPPEAQGSIYKFIIQNRLDLESGPMSQFLTEWVDHTFGKNSITTGPFPNRYAYNSNYIFVDEKCSCTTFRQKPLNSKPVEKSLKALNDQAIQDIQFIEQQRFALLRKNGLVQQVHLEPQPTEPRTFEIIWEIDYQLQYKQFLFFEDGNASDFLPVILLKKARFAAVGGYWDGKLVIHNVQEEKVSEVLEDNYSTITILASDPKNDVLAAGTKFGCLTLYSLGSKIKLIRQIQDHGDEINDLFLCKDLKAVLSSSNDGWAHLYNMYTGKYFRSFQTPKGSPIERVAIFTTPLYGVALYSSVERKLYSYSLNGQLLASKEIFCGQIYLKVCKDSKLNDILIVIKASEKTQLHLSTPFLTTRQEFRFTNYQQSLSDILTFTTSQDRKIYAFGTKDGEVGLGLDLRNRQDFK